MTTIRQKIENTKGKFFSLTYVNAKGEEGNYVCRTGVWKHLKGGKNYCPSHAITLYAVSKNGKREAAGYKTMYLDRIALKCGVGIESPWSFEE